MPVITVNSIRLNYDSFGAGEPVVLIMGTGGSGQIWQTHQVPALCAAGYRVVTFDNRGIGPSDLCAVGFTVDDLVGDVVGLAERLALGPFRVVGTSMGAYVAQELALARPELLRQAVFMASRSRSDALRRALAHAELDLARSGLGLPPRYAAVVRALQTLSPRTLNDEQQIRDWLDVLELAGPEDAGIRAQQALEPMPDRSAAYRGIGVPCHVISFADDLITPPEAGQELAGLIAGSSFEVIADAGHYGYLENPDAVNKSILSFFAASGAR